MGATRLSLQACVLELSVKAKAEPQPGSYLGLSRELLTADCREGVLVVSVASDREQLLQDCRLPSGWELLTEALSLEAKVRTPITVATTIGP